MLLSKKFENGGRKGRGLLQLRHVTGALIVNVRASGSNAGISLGYACDTRPRFHRE